MNHETARLTVCEVREGDAIAPNAHRATLEVARHMDITPKSLEETRRWVLNLM
jgi:hypothetical protein